MCRKIKNKTRFKVFILKELGSTGLYWALLGCIGLYWGVLGCCGLYWGLLGCAGLRAALGRTWQIIEESWDVTPVTHGRRKVEKEQCSGRPETAIVEVTMSTTH